MHSPDAIAAGPDGNLWFTEDDGNRIGRITPGGIVTEFSVGITAGAGPAGIAAGPDGNLWFTEVDGHRIGRITPSGVVTEFSAGITANAWPIGITAGSDGNLWFTGTLSGIGRITPLGVVTEFTVGGGTFGIAAGPDGNLWFTDIYRNRVGRITTRGVVTEFDTGITPGAGLAAITAGPDGNLWFAESLIHRIGRITTGVVSTSMSVVEFYHAAFDHYFITWMPDEIAILDTGHADQRLDAHRPLFQDLHFPAVRNLAGVSLLHSAVRWAIRTSSVAAPRSAKRQGRRIRASRWRTRASCTCSCPSAGVCPANTIQVYRVFSNRPDANHRYMIDKAVRDQMVAKGWLAEGDGPDLVVMCAPQ